MNWDQKVSLVTGVTSGIGYAIAKELAMKGVYVIAIGKNKNALMKLDDDIISAGGKRPILTEMDISNQDLYYSLAENIFQRFGRLDIFISAAAILGQVMPLKQCSYKLWKKVIDTNLTSNFLFMSNLLPLLNQSLSPRMVFTTCSWSRDSAYFAAYNASKAGLEAMVLSFAEELTHNNFRINLIDPGIVYTKLRRQAFPSENEDNRHQIPKIVSKYLELIDDDCNYNKQIIKI